MKKFFFTVLAVFFLEFVLYSHTDAGKIRVGVADFVDRSDRFCFSFYEGKELFDLNGKSLGKRIINLALLRVTNVHDDFSNAEILTQDNGNENDNKKTAPKKTDKKAAKPKSKKNV